MKHLRIFQRYELPEEEITLMKYDLETVHRNKEHFM